MAMLDNNGLSYFWGKLKVLLAGKANSSHTHAISDVNNLQTTLNGKAASTHIHVINDVTGLQNALDGKATTAQIEDALSKIADKITLLPYQDFGSVIEKYTLPSIAIGTLKPYWIEQRTSDSDTLSLPSGGRYIIGHCIYDTYNSTSGYIINIMSGGSIIARGYNKRNISGFYLRIE